MLKIRDYQSRASMFTNSFFLKGLLPSGTDCRMCKCEPIRALWITVAPAVTTSSNLGNAMEKTRKEERAWGLLRDFYAVCLGLVYQWLHCKYEIILWHHTDILSEIMPRNWFSFISLLPADFYYRIAPPSLRSRQLGFDGDKMPKRLVYLYLGAH